MELLSINQPLPNSSQVRNVPSVITLGPVQQSINRGVHWNFVRIRYFETSFCLSLRVKIIYLLGTKMKHFSPLSPLPLLMLLLFSSQCVYLQEKKKKQHTLLPSLSTNLICFHSSLWLVSHFGNTHAVYLG